MSTTMRMMSKTGAITHSNLSGSVWVCWVCSSILTRKDGFEPLVLVVAVDSWARSRGRRRPPGEEVEQKRLVLLRELLLSRVEARSTDGTRLRRRNEFWIHAFYGPARGQLWRDDEDEEEEEEKEV
ncbi:hypothetical protein BHE74_00002941 [Ensete ventricosum]|nr:hypothetical protein BHE74_00002941 [Ensete ventricosum]